MWEVTHLLQAVLSLVQPDAIGGQLLMRPFAVTGLVSLMSPQHLAAVTSWQHTSEEEGSNNTQSMVSLIAAILHNPFLPGGASDVLVKELQEVCTQHSSCSPSQCFKLHLPHVCPMHQSKHHQPCQDDLLMLTWIRKFD